MALQIRRLGNIYRHREGRYLTPENTHIGIYQAKQSTAVFFSYLLSAKLDLEVFCRLLSHPSTEVKLIHLTAFVPHGCLVVHDEMPSFRQLRWTPAEARSRVLRTTAWTSVAAARLKDEL